MSGVEEEWVKCLNLVVMIRVRVCRISKKRIAIEGVNGHTTLKTPLLVRSAKLSNVGSG